MMCEKKYFAILGFNVNLNERAMGYRIRVLHMQPIAHVPSLKMTVNERVLAERFECTFSITVYHEFHRSYGE